MSKTCSILHVLTILNQKLLPVQLDRNQVVLNISRIQYKRIIISFRYLRILRISQYQRNISLFIHIQYKINVLLDILLPYHCLE